MDSPARLLLLLAIAASCALAQQNSPQTQSISANGGRVFRNNRNPTTTTPTTTTTTAPIPTTVTIAQTTTTAAASTTPSHATSSASQSTSISASVPELPKQLSQKLTPLRNRTFTTTTTTPSTSTVVDEATDADGTVSVDPYSADLCIISQDTDAYQVNTSFTLNCGDTCRCVFRDEPKDLTTDFSFQATDNWKKPVAVPTEIRCSLPVRCSGILDKLVPSKSCPSPRLSPPSDSDPCGCPIISCGPPSTLISITPIVETRTVFLASTITPQPPTTVTAEPTTTPPPTTTTTSTVAATATTTRQTTRLIAPPTTTAPTTTTLATTLTDATTTISSTDSNRQTAPTLEPRVSPSSIMQAMEVPLQNYAAHLLIALAIMTSLFVFMAFMYLRRAFRSSMVPITDCYENPAFTKRVLLIDETDQNFRNKNKEVDGFSPRLLI